MSACSGMVVPSPSQVPCPSAVAPARPLPPLSRMSQRDDEHVASKWDAYASTVLEFPGPPPLLLDLREPVARAARETLAALGLDGPFAVFTPENPDGANVEDASSAGDAQARRTGNADRREALAIELELLGLTWCPVDGVAPDGSYRERCAAVRLGREEARERAARLRQLAWFWFDGSAFWLMPALAADPPRRLPA